VHTIRTLARTLAHTCDAHTRTQTQARLHTLTPTCARTHILQEDRYTSALHFYTSSGHERSQFHNVGMKGYFPGTDHPRTKRPEVGSQDTAQVCGSILAMF